MPHEVHGVGVRLFEECGYLVGDVNPAAFPSGVPVGKGIIVIAGEVVADSGECHAFPFQSALLLENLQVGEWVCLVEHVEDFGGVIGEASVKLPEQQQLGLVNADAAMAGVDGLGADDSASVSVEHENGEAVAQLDEIPERRGVVLAEGVAPQVVEHFGVVDGGVLFPVLCVKPCEGDRHHPLSVAAAALVVEACGEDACLSDDIEGFFRIAVRTSPAGVLRFLECEPLKNLLVHGNVFHGASVGGSAEEQQRCAFLVE